MLYSPIERITNVFNIYPTYSELRVCEGPDMEVRTMEVVMMNNCSLVRELAVRIGGWEVSSGEQTSTDINTPEHRSWCAWKRGSDEVVAKFEERKHLFTK